MWNKHCVARLPNQGKNAINEYAELLIGFDARESFLKFNDDWGASRVTQYLLREDIVKPLSVDVMVWDSILHVLQVQHPNWVGSRQGWDSLERLKAFITEHELRSPYWIIAITQWITNDEKNALEEQYKIKPAFPSNEWSLLGYDIADDSLLSGLMNAGYFAEEYTAIKQQWSRHLNEYHLFEDLDVAFKFKSLTDERVKEHSPFSVYSIYQLETIPEAK